MRCSAGWSISSNEGSMTAAEARTFNLAGAAPFVRIGGQGLTLFCGSPALQDHSSADIG